MNEVLSGIEKRLHDERDAILGVLDASTARLVALECLMMGVGGD